MNASVCAVAAAIAALLMPSGIETDRQPDPRSGLSPLRAIYRTRTLPDSGCVDETAGDARVWTFTRSGSRRFVGLGAQSPQASDERARHLELVEEAMHRRASPAKVGPTADAFGQRFTRHAEFSTSARSTHGLEEVWWSDELGLALVIARHQDGARHIDELVHLQFEEDGQLLAR